MPSARDIRRRIRSVKTTAQTTKAMQMISSTRMRRAQQRVNAARPYAEKIREVLSALAAQSGTESHPLLEARPPGGTIAVIEVTPDRGLCGPMISNLHRAVSRFALGQGSNSAAGATVQMIAVGRKARDFGLRAGLHLIGEFTRLSDQPALVDTSPISQLAMDEYIAGTVDLVYLAYTRFVSTMTQQPVVLQLLPIVPPQAGEAAAGRRLQAAYIYEPEPAAVLAELLPAYVDVLVYQAVLESKASEHSARMVAMRNATDNALDLVKDLTLSLNKARQAGITREIAEISAGANALAG
jgi:F-type H+-transporting ATPase subunit gamma